MLRNARPKVTVRVSYFGGAGMEVFIAPGSWLGVVDDKVRIAGATSPHEMPVYQRRNPCGFLVRV